MNDITQFEGTKEEQKKLASFYTPSELCQKMIDYAGEMKNKTVCDPTCGSGNILWHALEAKMNEGEDPDDAIREIYGVELDPNAHKRCTERFVDWAEEHGCNQESIEILKSHIVCSDVFEWDFEEWCPKSKNIPLF